MPFANDRVHYLPNDPEYFDEGLSDLEHIECEEDIHAHFRANPVDTQGRCRLSCSWCDTEHRGTLDATLAWFHEHPCSTQYASGDPGTYSYSRDIPTAAQELIATSEAESLGQAA